MTCIVGYADGKNVWLAGDASANGVNDAISTITVPKVFKKGKMLFGFCQSFRMGQILQYCFDPPEDNRDDPNEYFVCDFIPALKRMYVQHEYEASGENHGAIIVGYKGKLFTIEEDFGVLNDTSMYASIGSGSDVALGAMCALYETVKDPIILLIKVLSISEKHISTVRKPFTIVSTKKDKNEK